MLTSPRLLLLCEYATLNGGEQSLLATLPTIQDAGFEIFVALPPAGPLVDELHARRICCLPFSLFDAHGERLPLPTARKKLAELIEEVGPDLLHANSLNMGRLSGPVAQELKLPSLAHLRDIIGLSAAAIADLNCHSLLLAVSQATRNFHVAAGLDAAKSNVLYNGVDLDRFRPRARSGYLHRDLQLPAEVSLVGWIGQLGLRKDPLTFLAAANRVAPIVPAAHFLLVGGRNSGKQESLELEAAIHELVAKEPLAGRVHLLGVRTDIAELLLELTLLVHTARQEPLGRVLLEAAAAGTPVIATSVGGTAEIFPAETNSARMFAAGDAGALSDAILELLNNPATRKALSTNARHQAEHQFDIRQRAAELVELYRALIARSGVNI